MKTRSLSLFVTLCCIVLALSSNSVAQLCNGNDPPLTYCTQYNNVQYASPTGAQWVSSNDHSGSGSLHDHEWGFSPYTSPVQYSDVKCKYTGGIKLTDGCYQCLGQVTVTDSTSGSHYMSEAGSTISGLEHCKEEAWAEVTEGPLAQDVYGGIAEFMLITRLASGTSCSGNDSLPVNTGVNVNNPVNHVFEWSVTSQNGSSVYDHSPSTYYYQNNWEQVGFCAYEESYKGTPVVFALENFKDAFSGVDDGVVFDIFNQCDTGPCQKAVKTSWTKPGAQVAFLVLPDANGQVYNLHQLFGAASPQKFLRGTKLGGEYPDPYQGSGFQALQMYCTDGVLSKATCGAYWPQFRLWFNYAHDGVYDPWHKPNEIMTLDQFGLGSVAIDLNSYHETKDTDSNGNIKRFVSNKVTMANGNKVPEVYDVFFSQK